MLALLAQIHLPSLSEDGPGGLQRLLRVFFVLFGAGFFVALLGHLFASRALRAMGIAMVMLGTVAFMVAVGVHTD